MPKYRGDLIKHVCDTLGCDREFAEDAVAATLRGITDLTADGDLLVLKGFGTFSLRHRKGSMTRNPRDGRPMWIDPTTRLGFKAVKN